LGLKGLIEPAVCQNSFEWGDGVWQKKAKRREVQRLQEKASTDPIFPARYTSKCTVISFVHILSKASFLKL